MGNNPASSECQKHVKEVVQGCEGVAQMKDVILVHGIDLNHEARLQGVLHRLKGTGLTLREEKCELGMKTPQLLV